MQTVTCRVCAGPAIKQKQRANASIDNSSHLQGRGGSNLCNLKADVELFIDVLCDTGLQPVFSEDDREQVIAVYGPVHARLLRQSLELISDAGEVKKK